MADQWLIGILNKVRVLPSFNETISTNSYLYTLTVDNFTFYLGFSILNNKVCITLEYNSQIIFKKNCNNLTDLINTFNTILLDFRVPYIMSLQLAKLYSAIDQPDLIKSASKN
jgi:hypothetical protein